MTSTTTRADAGDQLFGLVDRVAVVIGAASGIGEAVAFGCARQGARVRCLDMDTASAQQTADAITGAGGVARSDSLDIRDAAAVQTTLARIDDEEGRLDVVVCTPGVNVRKPIVDYTPDEVDRVLSVNLSLFNRIYG